MVKPIKIYYECTSRFDLDTSVFSSMSVNFIGRYVLDKAFKIKRDIIHTYDLIFVYGGSLTVRYKNNCYTVSENELFFLHTDIQYEIQSESAKNTDVLFLSCNGNIYEEYYKIIMKHRLKTIQIRNSESINDCFEKIVFYMKYPSNHNNVLAIDAIIHLFTQIFIYSKNIEELDDFSGHPNWFVKTIAFIDKYYQKNISVEQISAYVGLSASHLYKLFREYTGSSPYQYLLDARINNAKILLNNSDLSVKYIAHAVGFKSVNLFIGHFKRLTGYTPNCYREKL